MGSRVANPLLLLATLALAAWALVSARSTGEDAFAGTDGQARELVAEVAPGYEPWVEPWWEPPGAEIESLLFGLQAAIGAGLLGYVLGFMRGSRRKGSDA